MQWINDALNVLLVEQEHYVEFSLKAKLLLVFLLILIVAIPFLL
ncbi:MULTISPECIES: hypothetical protein [unclassified Siphonobacter]|nr:MULTISPECIES: hypothetical protein [unclassified Siphonobacter]